LAYEEFDGELDDAADGFVPFEGELDAPAPKAEPRPTPNVVRRGTARSGASPFVAGEEPRDNVQALRRADNEIEAKRVGSGSVLDRPYTGPRPSTFSSDEMQGLAAMEVEPGKAARDRAELARRAAAPTLKAGQEPSALRDLLSGTVAKPLDNSLLSAAIETGGDAVRGVAKAGTNFADAGYGIVRAGADLVGAEDVSKWAGYSGEAARGYSTQMLNPTDPESMTTKVFESTFSSVPLMLAAPGAPLTAMMAMSGSQEYSRSRANGLKPMEAGERAVVMGLAEGIGERFSLPAFQSLFAAAAAKASTKELGGILADMLVKEQVGEQVTQMFQSGYEKLGQYGTRPNMTLREYIDDSVETAKVTLGQTLLTGGLAGGVRSLASQQSAAIAEQQRQAMEILRAPKVEAMPTTPFTPEQIGALKAAAPINAPDTGAPSVAGTSAPMAEPAAGAPIGVAGVAQGSLADLADQQLRGGNVQPNVAAPPGAPAGAAAVGGDQPNGSVGAVRPVPAEPGQVLPAAGSPTASAEADRAAVPADVPRQTLEPKALVDEGTHATRGEALAYAANEGMGRRVDIVETPDGKFALQPRVRPANEATQAEDTRELEGTNAAIAGADWQYDDGTPVVLRAVPDKQTPPRLSAAASAIEAAFGIRVVSIAGAPGNGIQHGRRAYVSVDKANPEEVMLFAAFHEAGHWLETNDPAAAQVFKEGILPLLKAGVVDAQLKFENENLGKNEVPMTRAGAESEVLQDINGKALLQSETWQRIYDLDQGSTFRKVLYIFMKQMTKLIKVAKGGRYDLDQFVTDRAKVIEITAKVWAERARNKDSSPIPANLPPRTAQKRADKRQPGEKDKAFAKRVVDVREAPADLPEKPDRYFTRPAGTQDMKISRLISSKSEAENKQGGDNGAKRMAAAAAGELSKRDPVTVMPSEKVPGSFEVVDGNGTLTTVKKYGWAKLPVVVVSREEGLAAIAEDKRKDKIKKNGWVLFDKDSGTKGIPRADMPQVSTTLRPDLYEWLKKEAGITSSYVKDVPAESLKPTQAEYSRKKVDELLSKPADPPSETATKMHVLMSSDGYILDGHHRTEARREDGGVVDGIRFNATIDELMAAVWGFPFTKVNMESEGLLTPAPARPELDAARLKKIDEAVKMAAGAASEKSIAAAVDTLKRFEGVPAVDIPVDTRKRLEAMLAPLLETAKAENAGYNEALERVAKDNDWRPVTAPTKSMKRSVEKMFEDERLKPGNPKADATWLKDAVRGSIVVRDVSEVPAAIEAVEKAFKVVRIKNRFDKPLDSGYRDVLLNVELPSGQIAELQIHIPQMLATKELGHLLFEIERATRPSADRARLAQAARALYGSAYDLADATMRSNSSRVSGEPSLATREKEMSAPVQPDKQMPVGKTTIGMSSTSAKVVPGGSLDKSGAISSPSGSPILPRQARAKAPLTPEEQLAAALKPAPKKRLRPGQRLHQVPADPAIGARIAEQLGLTPEELAATSLPMATGKGKGDAFSAIVVGGIPSTVAELTRRRTESGLRELDSSKPEDREILAKLMAAEALAGINAEGSAVEWYDATINRMLAMASVKYPELAKDQDARNSFIVAMAITSQGLNVENNLGFAMRQYEAYRESSPDPEKRRFPIASEGKNGKPMQNNFKVANGMIERLGLDKFRRMLRTDFTVGELKKAGWKIGGEKMGEKVLGSSIFGPKIGFGFYSNLSGNFEPVTMDMWFMRTIGRLANTLRSFDAKKFQKQTDRFLASLEERGDNALFADKFDPEMVEAAKAQVPQVDTETGEELLDASGEPIMGPDGDAIEALARLVNKAHQAEFKARRAEFDAKTRVKSDLVASSDTILKSLDKPRDSPASGGERQDLRDVVRRTVAMVEKAYGKRVPPAALQALIWYPEQELYRNHGVSLNVTSQDYAGAIRKRLESEGYDGQQLTAAESGSRQAQRLAGKPDGQGARREDGQAGGSVQLSAEERTEFLASTTPAPKVKTKGPKQSRARYASDDVALEAGYAPGDYTALEGRTVERSITLDDGKVATLKMDAAQALRTHDERINVLEKLRACLKGAA
jgi:hypothetical protein